MKRSTIFLGLAALVVVAAAAGLARVNHMARVASAYKAKALCSEVFLAGRDAKSVEAVEFAVARAY